MKNSKSGHLKITFDKISREIGISNIHVVVLSNTLPDLLVINVDL